MVFGAAGMSADLLACQSSMVWGSEDLRPCVWDATICSFPWSVLLYWPLAQVQIRGQSQLNDCLNVFQRKSCGSMMICSKKRLRVQVSLGNPTSKVTSLYFGAFLSQGSANVCCKSWSGFSYGHM